MGRSGYGIFDSDGAMDQVHSVQEYLVKEIEAHWAQIEEDEDIEDQFFEWCDLVVPLVGVLAVVREQCGISPPEAEKVLRWKNRTLETYRSWFAKSEAGDPQGDAEMIKNVEAVYDRLLGAGNR